VGLRFRSAQVLYRKEKMDNKKNITNDILDEKLNTVKVKIEELLQEEGTDEIEGVSICTTQKNNGVLMKGIQIRVKCGMIAPVFYPPTEYLKSENSEEKIAENIVSQFLAVKDSVHTVKIELNSYEKVRNSLRIGLLNIELNRKRLNNVPYRAFLDLAEVLVLELEIDNERGDVLVNTKMLQEWNVDEEDAFSEARLNSYFYEPAKIEKLDSVIGEMVGTENMGSLETPFLYLSNEKGRRGASAILYPDTSDRLLYYTKGESFYVIPSSVCELLILPKSTVESRDEVKQMISDVNRNVLERQEILSDCLYFFDSSKMQYEIVP